jgi:penicillin-binding protein-related factor A (putative recombinase)
MTEKQIESQILEWLNLQPGVFAFKVNTTGLWDAKRKIFRTIKNPYIHKGTSDIIGIKNGKFFAIEVKTIKELNRIKNKMLKGPQCPINQHTELQYNFLNAIKIRHGHSCFSSSLDDVIEFIKTME